MSSEGPKALILRPAYGLQQPGSGAEKVLSRIVSDALTIARGRDVADISVRIRIGKYEFHERDYQQILIWADATEKSPEGLVSLLAEVKSAFLDGSSFLVENGSIKQVAFQSGNDLTELDLSKVPALTHLGCSENQLTELDLSNVSALIVLYCHKNQLTELDLSNVSALTQLSVGENQLTELDLSNVPALNVLWCGSNPLTELDLSNVPALTRVCAGAIIPH